MSAKARTAKTSEGAESDSPSIVLPLPTWIKAAAFIVALWGGLITWQIQRGLGKLDLLADRVGRIDPRVAALEERLPQPLYKELAPLVEEVRKLALEFAELRGQLGGKPPVAAKSRVSD